jgi:hypothetical protein
MNNDYFQPDRSRRLFFYETDLVIYFPSHGNDDGRSISKYGVRYRDFKNKRGQSGVAINLEDVLSLPQIKNGYPHTICYFEAMAIVKSKYPPENCIDRRKIQDENALYHWIAGLGL